MKASPGDGGLFYPEDLAELVATGVRAVQALYLTGAPLNYVAWRQQAREDLDGLKDRFTEEHFRWLWSALPEEPVVGVYFGRSGVVGPPVDVLPEGACFHFSIPQDCPPPHETQEVRAVILKPLKMKLGRGDDYECCPVTTEVHVSPCEPRTLEGEGERFRVHPSHIRLHDRGLTLTLPSLDKAYRSAWLGTVPYGPNPGGSIYNRILWVHDDGRRTYLESIRALVRTGRWLTPTSPHHAHPEVLPLLR